MKIKRLTTERLYKTTKGKPWVEGVDLVGYWEEGESFIFKDDDIYICISLDFLWELIKKTGEK